MFSVRDHLFIYHLSVEEHLCGRNHDVLLGVIAREEAGLLLYQLWSNLGQPVGVDLRRQFDQLEGHFPPSRFDLEIERFTDEPRGATNERRCTELAIHTTFSVSVG